MKETPTAFGRSALIFPCTTAHSHDHGLLFLISTILCTTHSNHQYHQQATEQETNCPLLCGTWQVYGLCHPLLHHISLQPTLTHLPSPPVRPFPHHTSHPSTLTSPYTSSKLTSHLSSPPKPHFNSHPSSPPLPSLLTPHLTPILPSSPCCLNAHPSHFAGGCGDIRRIE